MRLKQICALLFTTAILAVSSFSTHAGFIKFNGQDVQVLNLNGVASSFDTFYNYRAASARTGLEQKNTLIMFVAELNNNYGLFTIVNKAGSNGDNGHLNSVITSTSGEVTLTDDPKEASVTNKMIFYWAGNFTDGYIFSEFADNFTFEQMLTSRKGLIGAKFINFKDGTIASAEYSSLMGFDSSFSLVRNVPAPSVILLLLFAGLIMRVTRKK